MTDRPILFSAPMVRALLAGRKTQTRRLATSPLAKAGRGDRLWVREAWFHVEPVRSAPLFVGHAGAAAFKADDTFIGCHRWKPSIHMPRWASRLTLEVTEVRRQDLWDITTADAMAEGLFTATSAELCIHEDADGQLIPDRTPGRRWYWAAEGLKVSSCPREAYRALWDHLHGVGSFDSGPEVVALSFTVHPVNIDSLDPAPCA